jgi:tetratricopeptide (TPR) repeat protein/DNA-binding CsgD family transcriptional regulator
MLETLREYAWERLVECGEAEILRQRHARLFLDLAEQAEDELRGPNQVVWADRLEQEQDNLRVALEWALGGGAEEVGVRLAGALVQFWRLRGYFSQGLSWLEAAVAASGRLVAQTPAAIAQRVKALQGLGSLIYDTGDFGAARAPYEESLALSRQLGDKTGIARSLDGLGLVALREEDNPSLAQARHQESLALYRELGDKDGSALALYHLGHVALQQEDYLLARSRYEESLALWRTVGNRSGMALAINNLGLVASCQSDYPLERSFYEQSLALWREAGDKQGISFALTNLGIVAAEQGDLDRAQELLEESLIMHRDMGNRQNIASDLLGLGLIAHDRGDFPTARSLLEESLMLNRAIGDRAGIAWALTSMGTVALGEGDYARARALHEESLALFRELSYKTNVAYPLDNLGDLALAEGDVEQAAQYFEQSLALLAAGVNRRGIAERLEGLAAVRAAQGDLGHAARLWGAAEALRETIGAPLPPLDGATYDRFVGAARAQADATSFAAAWEEGRALTLDQAVAAALKQVAPPQQPGIASTPTGPRPTMPAYPAGLTAREVEVLRLVATGLTDAEVAERLVLSTRTVNKHLQSIYGKLGLSSRSAATRYAVDHGLT